MVVVWNSDLERPAAKSPINHMVVSVSADANFSERSPRSSK